MTPDSKKSKSDYGFISINVRGDREYVNDLKTRAISEGVPFADYVREKLDCAIACEDNSFFAQGGSPDNQSGKV